MHTKCLGRNHEPWMVNMLMLPNCCGETPSSTPSIDCAERACQQLSQSQSEPGRICTCNHSPHLTSHFLLTDFLTNIAWSLLAEKLFSLAEDKELRDRAEFHLSSRSLESKCSSPDEDALPRVPVPGVSAQASKREVTWSARAREADDLIPSQKYTKHIARSESQ